jgi:hypothetical protein
MLPRRRHDGAIAVVVAVARSSLIVVAICADSLRPYGQLAIGTAQRAPVLHRPL